MGKRKRSTHPPKEQKNTETEANGEEMADQNQDGQMEVDEEIENERGGEDCSELESSFTAADSIPTSGHSKLLDGLESTSKLVNLVQLHRSKKDEFDLEEVLPILTKDEQVAMWDRLSSFASECCEALIMTDQDQELNQDSLGAIALICRICLGIEEVISSPSPGLKRTIQTFSENLLKFETSVSENLSKCIEMWYTASLEDREDYAVVALKYLLLKTLSDKGGTKNDVKRAWALNNILLSIRLHESGLEDLLLRCLACPLYLTVGEGTKFLVTLFSLSVPFIQKIHKQLKNSLTTLTQKQSYALGEVYMKAWSQSGGSFRSSLEEHLQKIMDEGLLVNRSKYPSLSKNVLAFLSCFHDNKQNSELKSVLSRLYTPFIWRYIKCNNNNIRLNAVEAFLSAYPLEDLSSSNQEREEEINRQNSILRSLLVDDVVEIRTVTLLGLGRILANYWLLLSSDTINSFMDPIVKDLSCDSVSKVRIRVYQCLKQILHTSYSHVYMKEILPKFKMGLHDVNEGVRIAFLDLLLAVKGIKIIRYWDICSLENLLGQLEVDKPVVSRAIVKLLVPSMFPKESTTEELLNRALKLQNMNTKAARKFYVLVVDLVEKEKLLELMYGILDSVRHYLKSKSGDRKERKKKKLYDKSVLDDSVERLDATSTSSVGSSTMLSSSESRSEVEDNHVYSDINLVGGVLDCVCILWYNLNQQLCEDENKDLRLYLEQKVAKCILTFFKHYRDTSISSTIVYLASFLSHSSVNPVASYSLSQLKKSDNFEIHAEALVNWRRGNEVLELLQEWMQGEMSTPTPKPHGVVQFKEPDMEKPSLQKIIKITEFILRNETIRMILLRKNPDDMKELSQTTSRILVVIQDKIGKSEIPEKRRSDLVSILELHLHLAISLGIHFKDLIEQMEEIISWADVQLVPVIFREVECGVSSVRLAEEGLLHILKSVQAVLMTGHVDESFVKRVLDFLKQIVTYLPFAEPILDVEIETATLSYTKQFMDIYEEDLPVSFVNFLKVYSQEGHRLEDNRSKAIKSRINKFLRLYSKVSKIDHETNSLRDLVETVSLALLQAAEKEVDNTEIDVIVNRCGDIDQKNLKLQVLMYRSSEVLYSVLLENKQFHQISLDTLMGSIDQKGVHNLFVLLSLMANIGVDKLTAFLPRIQNRLDDIDLYSEVGEEEREYLEPCRRMLTLYLEAVHEV